MRQTIALTWLGILSVASTGFAAPKAAAGKAPLPVNDFSTETLGAEPKTFSAAVGYWTVTPDGDKKVLAVDGTKWEEGKSSVNLADKARSIYGEKYAEFLDNVKAYAYFPFAVANYVDDFSNGEISVKFKPMTGKIDQAAGILFNVKPNGDYLIVRANALEENLVLFKYVKGKRSSVKWIKNVPTSAKQWHTLKVVIQGKEVKAYLGDELRLEHTLAEPVSGKVGLWSKADSLTHFTDFTVRPASAKVNVWGASAPAGVFVVNTKSASVSLIDLKNNREIQKISVGSSPYGVAIVQDGATLAVGVEGEERVKFYDTKAFKLKGETKIGKMHNDHIIVTQDGKHLMVANFHSDDVLFIDVNTRKIAYRLKGLSAPHVVKYGPLLKRAFLTCKKVTGIGIIDPKSRKVLKNHELNVNPRSLTFSPDESKLYFGSFWVDGIFEMETDSGKVTRLIGASPPSDNSAPQEVTYHGVEAVGSHLILAANEGRSYVDVFDMTTGKQLDRFTEVSKPCCIERIPGSDAATERVLISNIGDGTMTLAEVSREGKLKKLARIAVGEAPKRVVFTGDVTGTLFPGE